MLDEVVCDRKTVEAAFHGTHGTFGEDAALRMLPPDSNLLPCSQLEQVFDAVNDGATRHGVIPVENTVTGSVQRAYDLLYKSNLTIVGETVCRVDNTLTGLPGARLERIRKVYAHPATLTQCWEFFRRQPAIEAVAVYDTEGPLKKMIRKGDPTFAAIASRRAAEACGAVLLAESVHDHSESYTRFLMISKQMEMVRLQTVDYKRTLVFRIVNEPGALCRALLPFADRNIDIARIDSRALQDSAFEYLFYLDIVGGADYEEVFDAIEELRRQTLSVRVLGMYPCF